MGAFFFVYNVIMMPSKSFDKWPVAIKKEMQKSYFQDLIRFVENERKPGELIFPPRDLMFTAFETTPYDCVKVVILGQDPYHKRGQAHGLSFSVPDGVKRPPSLMNIYKELNAVDERQSGNLLDWAEQGVFLLNSVLTVKEGQAASHRGKGWEDFTDVVLKTLNKKKEPVVFMLWGAYAQKKAVFLDNESHLVLCAPHPSPLSAYRGFLGCGHFHKANQFLRAQKAKPINWV